MTPPLARILIVALVCAVCMPVVMAAFAVQTSPSIKPSSCFISPKYPDPQMSVDFIGATEGYVQQISWLNEGIFDGPPYTVQFHDLTTAPAEGQTIASRYWNFGDGTTSNEQNPQHTYKFTGSYHVLLSVTTICGSDYTKKSASTVNISCPAPVPGFTSDAYEGTAPLTVHITDTSTHTPAGITSWTYTFDSSHSSNDRNPVFTYTVPGTYTIIQMVGKSCGGESSANKPSQFSAKRQIKVYAPVYGYAFGSYSEAYSVGNATTVPTPSTTVPATGVMTITATAFPVVPVPSSISGTDAQGIPLGGVPQGVPPAIGTGSLSVITNPSGAQVWVDEMLWGASPASISGLSPGAHTLRLERAGYQNLSVPVAITEGKTAEYSLALVPASSGGKGIAPLSMVTVIIALTGAGAFLCVKRKRL